MDIGEVKVIDFMLWERYKTAAKKYAGIPIEEEEMHPSYRGLPDYGDLEV